MKYILKTLGWDGKPVEIGRFESEESAKRAILFLTGKEEKQEAWIEIVN